MLFRFNCQYGEREVLCRYLVNGGDTQVNLLGMNEYPTQIN